MTLDHVGPMARSALDCALALSAIAGHDPLDPYSADMPNEDYSAGIDLGVRGLRIAVPTNHFFDGLETDVESLVRSAVEVLGSLGAELVEVEIPWAEPRYSSITRVELAAVHKERLEDPEFAAGLRRGTLTRMWNSNPVSVNRYASDLHRKVQLVRLGEELMKEVDLIATPSAPRAAPAIAEAETKSFLQKHRYIGGAFNQSGQPSMSVPCGFTKESLPAGLMLTGGLWKERLVLRAGHAYQQVTDWHLRRPPGVD
jgi:aspartyl-tRNA(Asn)/glutamyl-tRNA(Gln) amidotransferase subunit A